MSAFVPATPLSKSPFTPTHQPSLCETTLPKNAPASTKMSTSTYRYSPIVDQFFAKDVRAQYIAKACPTGVPPLQCIEGTTALEPYEVRTLKRQSALRFRQLPTAVKIHNMYATRQNALVSCHGCAHEEDRVLRNPMLASAMSIGQAEANRACNRYIESSGKVEDFMCRAVENIYSKAVNGSGVFSTACTDGQAKYEAYLAQVRCGSTTYRMKQYSESAKAGAAFAARKMAIARKHICVYEDGLYAMYPRLAGSMRPEFGYYTPFVTLPSEYMYPAGIVPLMDTGRMAALDMLGMMTSTAAKPLSIAAASAPEE